MPTPTHEKIEINRLYKLILAEAKELDKVFSQILNAQKYKNLWPNVKQWIEWVGIARKMAKSASTKDVDTSKKKPPEKYYTVQININNITGLHPATHEKICGLVSQISSMISEINSLNNQNGKQESDDETQPHFCPVGNFDVK